MSHLVLIPPSCCGAGYFRRVRRSIGARLEVTALELAGHGRRFAEPAVRTAQEAVHDLVERLPEGTTAVYGESLGAYLALAVAGHAPGISTILAAANIPPSQRAGDPPLDEGGGLAEAVAALTGMGGQIPPEVLVEPSLANSAARLIRADLALGADLAVALKTTRTDARLSILAGDADPSLRALEAWQDHARDGADLTVISGGHLLSSNSPQAVADWIVRRIDIPA
jgi:surfactin synthase thioesterase subunit